MIERSQRGRFITIEGIEGVGKSTAINHLQRYLHQKTIPLVVTREPGGTPIAEDIRNLLLTPHLEAMCHETELLLMFAARAQHLSNIIIPSLHEGLWVISDRFTDASFAYQGGGREINLEQIAQLENWVQKGFQPDLTILLHAPVDIALSRAKKRGEPDRIESEEHHFFERVQNVYFERAKQFPERFRLLAADEPIAVVQKNLEDIIDNYIASIGWKYD